MHRSFQPFRYCEAESVHEAAKALQECGSGSKGLAGGVDLAMKMRIRKKTPEVVVSLHKNTRPGRDCRERGKRVENRRQHHPAHRRILSGHQGLFGIAPRYLFDIIGAGQEHGYRCRQPLCGHTRD